VRAVLCGCLAILFGACGGSPTAPPPATLSLACPANLERPSPGGGPVTVTYAMPAVSGGSAPVSVSCQPASGSDFRPGSTPVTCTASDGAGRPAACSFSIVIALAPQLRVTRFLAFGDSLSEGKVSVRPGLPIESPPHSYPYKLETLLRERYPQDGVVVLNEGFGGERATQSYPRFQDALDVHRPDAVLLMHGMNDLNGDGLPGVQAAVDGVEELVKEARRAGLPTLVATLPPMGDGPKASCPACIDPFNDRIRAVAAAKGALLVDVERVWGTGAGLMGADGIHPTEAGYEAIAAAFFEVIRQHLETAAPASE